MQVYALQVVYQTKLFQVGGTEAKRRSNKIYCYHGGALPTFVFDEDAPAVEAAVASEISWAF